MKTTYSITKVQSQLPRLVREGDRSGPIRITRHDETVAYLMTTDRFEALLETLEIMANPAAWMSVQKYRKGQMKFVGLD